MRQTASLVINPIKVNTALFKQNGPDQDGSHKKRQQTAAWTTTSIFTKTIPSEKIRSQALINNTILPI